MRGKNGQKLAWDLLGDLMSIETHCVHEFRELGEVVPPAGMYHLFAMMVIRDNKGEQLVLVFEDKDKNKTIENLRKFKP